MPLIFRSTKKGSYQATQKLKDNSKVIINAFDRENAGLIMRYVRTLIEPEFLIDYKDNNYPFVGSNLNRNLVETDLKAVYVKAYQGHLSTAPLWTKNLF